MPDGGGRRELVLRIVSALVLAPVALGAIHVGAGWFNLLVGLGALVLTWEWNHLCGQGIRSMALLVTTSVAGAVIFASMGAPDQGLLLIAVSGVSIFVMMALAQHNPSAPPIAYPTQPQWLASGILYIGLPCVALIWLRNGIPMGRETVLWLFGLVWAVDIGAFAFGRLIGGARIAPTISPNKTWAGLIGAIASGGVAGAVAGWLLDKEETGFLIAFSALLGVVEQGGDFFESWIKRRFSVKDMGSLIPGHGGLFDRVDGLLAVAVTIAAAAYAVDGDLLQWL